MQHTRDTETGDFKITGTEDEIKKATAAVAEAFGDDDSLVEEWTQAVEDSAAHVVEVTIPREGVAEVADVWAFSDDGDLVELGEAIGTEIEKVNAELIAKAEAEG